MVWTERTERERERERNREKPREVGLRFEVVGMRPFFKTSFRPALCNSESLQLWRKQTAPQTHQF